MKSFLETVRERVVIYDGAMGTQILARNLCPDDFWGKPDCTEILVLSRPEIVKDIHAGYFKAGADVVETNTFNGSSIMLREHDLAKRVHEINKRGAEIAREVATDFSTAARPRFVAGSIGPGNKIPSLGHISYDDMYESYLEQSLGLIDGWVDILLIETCQDILQTKVSVAAAFEAMKQRGKRIPVQAQVTLQESGTMLLGTEIGAAETALEPFDCEILGLNCATGPKEMNDAVRYLAHNAPKEISILPNAGLPENVGGVAHYRLTPQSLAEWHKKFITEYGVRIVGGCCGTTPVHIKAVADLCANLEPAKRDVQVTPSASSAYSSVPLDLDPKPLIVAEEMNTTTRVEHFKNMVREGKYDDI